jgi:hypothetical protein
MTWHSGLIYKLSESEFSTSLIKLIVYYLTNRKCQISVNGELFTPREIAAGVSQVFVLATVFYSQYITDAPAAPETHVSLFADDA